MNFLPDYKSGSSSQHFEEVVVLFQKGEEITQFEGIGINGGYVNNVGIERGDVNNVRKEEVG
jgi:hypothetical protein